MTDLPTSAIAVLVVDDEPRSLEAIRRTLDEEFDVLTATGAAEGLKLLDRHPIGIVLCDQRMPETTGVEFLTAIRESHPEAVRIVISGYTDSEDIIQAINEAGIYHYVTKPWHPDALLLLVRRAAEFVALQRRHEILARELLSSETTLRGRIASDRGALQNRYAFAEIISSETSPIRPLCDQAARIAPSDISVLVQGESGTGKELFARAIHFSSPRSGRPFVVQNCGALPDELLESELFGHKRGAFTGAVQDHVGLFEQADGGTIFLDEIGETSPAFQVRLLRVLQEGEVRPLGAATTRRIDVRVIAATNRDLGDEMNKGGFRADLYWRLAHFVLSIPPLRERPDDIPVIADYLLGRLSCAEKVTLDPPLLKQLSRYPFPGNVRELENELRRMVALGQGAKKLGSDLLSDRVRSFDFGAALGSIETDGGTLKDRVDRLEAGLVRQVLSEQRGNISAAARQLGLSRVGLYNKMRRHGIEGGGDGT